MPTNRAVLACAMQNAYRTQTPLQPLGRQEPCAPASVLLPILLLVFTLRDASPLAPVVLCVLGRLLLGFLPIVPASPVRATLIPGTLQLSRPHVMAPM